MSNFDKLHLTKYAETADLKGRIVDLLDKIVTVLNDKVVKKEIECECENGEEICFDCLRFEAETILADDFQLDDLDEHSLEMYSDLFEHELDKQVAKVVTNYKENI